MDGEFIQRQKDRHFYEITSLGGNWIYILISVFFLVLGEHGVFNRLLFGFIVVYFAVFAIKIFYFKKRPKKYPYSSFIEKIDASSFPSVHAARSAFLAIVMMVYFNNTLISVFLAILAILVAHSRIYLREHDIYDVSAGFFLGILIYFAVNFVL